MSYLVPADMGLLCAWVLAGAVAFGWWKGSWVAGIFAFILLLGIFSLSAAAMEIAAILLVGIEHQDSHAAKPSDNSETSASNRDRETVALKTVYTFGLWLYPKFLELAKLTQEEWQFALSHGRFFQQLTLERWANHSVARVSEYKSGSESQEDAIVRSFNVYHTDITLLDDTVRLWRVPLGPAEGIPSEEPCLELQWKVYEECFRLIAMHGRFGCRWLFEAEPEPGNILLSVPLEPKKLAPYKTPDDDMEVTDGRGYESKPWRACYQCESAEKGISWTLWIRDFEEWIKPRPAADSPK
jgi:hypothetical protein